MALQDILKKIQAEAELRIVEIEKQLEKDKQLVSKEMSAKEKEELAALDQRTELALNGVDTKIDTMARRENRQALLGARRNMLDKAVEAFYKMLVESDDKVKSSIYESQIKQLSIEKGTAETSKTDVTLLKELLGAGFEVKASESVEGGFICHAGGMEIDNSFKNLIYSEYKQPLEMYFADQLKLA